MSDEKKVKIATSTVGTPKAAAEKPPAAPGANGAKQPKSRRERFRQHISRRMTAALKRLTMLARLGNAKQYEYTPEEAARIVRDLKDRVEQVVRAFQGQQQRADGWSL